MSPTTRKQPPFLTASRPRRFKALLCSLAGTTSALEPSGQISTRASTLDPSPNESIRAVIRICDRRAGQCCSSKDKPMLVRGLQLLRPREIGGAVVERRCAPGKLFRTRKRFFRNRLDGTSDSRQPSSKTAHVWLSRLQNNFGRGAQILKWATANREHQIRLHARATWMQKSASKARNNQP